MMKGTSRYLQEIFVEIALAEERQVCDIKDNTDLSVGRVEKLFTAITFAEAGEFGTVREILDPGPDDRVKGSGYCAAGFCAGRA